MTTDTREALAALPPLHGDGFWEERMKTIQAETKAPDTVEVWHALWRVKNEVESWAIKYAREAQRAALATQPAQPSAELLNLRAEAEALRKALLAIVDRDLTFFDGCVDRNTITYGEIQQARAAIAATKEQQA